MNATENNTVETILEQLGGKGKLVAMVGATSFLSCDSGRMLKFRFAGNRKMNICTVSLVGDLYEVTFYNARQTWCVEVAKREMVYADMLVQVFENITGLYLSL